MKLVKWTDQIEYLVNRKFPCSKAPPPISISNIGHSSSYNYEQHEKLLVDIKKYREELYRKTQAEVKALCDAECDKQLGLIQSKRDIEESQRFFNQVSANADFVHWSKAAHWSLDEAIALSFGKSPNIVSWSEVNKYTEVSPFAERYAKRRDLALRALHWNKLFDPMLPTIFISWAKELDIELPKDLISNVEKKLGIAINWFDEYKKIKAAYDELQNSAATISVVAEKPLHPRTENNYLRLIMALANGIKNFNPSKPYEAAKLILDETGIENISRETISNYISKAHALDSKERG